MPDDRVVFNVTLGELSEVPGSSYAYWAPKSLRDLFQKFPPVDRDVARQPDKPKVADVKQGLATADDLRFLRYWWEVPVEQIATSPQETRKNKKWVPFAKGGEPFFHDIILVVNWAQDGEEIKNYISERYPYLKGKWQWVVKNESFYFRAGLGWARMIVSNRLDFSFVPKGCIFSHAGGGGQLFFNDEELCWAACALLNSTLKFAVFTLMNPIAHGKEAGVIARLFVNPEALSRSSLRAYAREAHDLLCEWATGEETATLFVAPWMLQVWLRQGKNETDLRPISRHPLTSTLSWRWKNARTKLQGSMQPGERARVSIGDLARECMKWEIAVRNRVQEIERRIDDEVYALYDIDKEQRSLIEWGLIKQPEMNEDTESDNEAEDEKEARTEVMSGEEHIRRLVHYFAHEVIKADNDGIVPLYDIYTADARLERGLAYRVRERFLAAFGRTAEDEVCQAIETSLEDWFAEDFFDYHTRLYRQRPIVWQLVSGRSGKPAFSCFLYWQKLDADTLRKVQDVYLRPAVDNARREADRLAQKHAEFKSAEDRSAWREAENRHAELQRMNEQIQRLLLPHVLSVRTRSKWVREKVNEVVTRGYSPNRDYGVSVNIEPLKNAGILPASAERSKV
jgi:hypothetical protein